MLRRGRWTSLRFLGSNKKGNDAMKSLMIWFTVLVFLTPTPSFAQSWSGSLVDSKCYDSEERSFNPFDVSPNLDCDKDQEIRICTPSSRTKSFAVVGQGGWVTLKLDPYGNERAVALVRKFGKKSHLEVSITGERKGNTIFVHSISTAK